MSIHRIAIFGPESTGKTTLAQWLAGRFGEPWAPEFVREFWDLREGTIRDEDLGTIALGQIAGEERAAADARRAVFCDTELLTCVLWNDLLYPGRCPAWVRTEADERAKAFSLFLFCDTDVAFVPDPQRSFSDVAGRERCRRLWQQTLDSRRLPYVTIQGAWSERQRIALAAVEQVLAEGPLP